MSSHVTAPRRQTLKRRKSCSTRRSVSASASAAILCDVNAAVRLCGVPGRIGEKAVARAVRERCAAVCRRADYALQHHLRTTQ